MNKTEFRKAVLKTAPRDLPRAYLSAAIDLYLSDSARGTTDQNDIAGCIEMTRVIRSSLAESTDRTDALTEVPAVLMDSRKIAEAIRPIVEMGREMYFGSQDPPFSSREEAVRWLRETAKQQKRPSAKGEEKAWDMIFKAQALIKKPVLLETIQLPYIDPRTGELEHLEGFFGSPIHILSGQVEALAEMTGFSRVGLVEYILAGIPPLLPAFRLKGTWIPTQERGGKTGLLKRSATVEINSRHITEQQLRRLWREINRSFNPKGKKPARTRTVLLISTVRRCLENRPAGENKTEFWKRVQAEFNKNAGRRVEKYLSWQAPRRSYLRLAETPEYDHLPRPD